jgi:hypothetical protein
MLCSPGLGLFFSVILSLETVRFFFVILSPETMRFFLCHSEPWRLCAGAKNLNPGKLDP